MPWFSSLEMGTITEFPCNFTCQCPLPKIFLEVCFMCIFGLVEYIILKIASLLGIHTDKVELMCERVIFFLQNFKKRQKNISQNSQGYDMEMIKSTKHSS